MKKNIIVEVISYAFFFLFVYAALSKIILYDTFLDDLGRAPFTAKYAIVISLSVPASEIITALLLALDKTKRLGLFLSFILMFLFTCYVGYVLSTTQEQPCSCGGIFRDMSWPSHMYFNTIATVVAFVGFRLKQKGNKELAVTN